MCLSFKFVNFLRNDFNDLYCFEKLIIQVYAEAWLFTLSMSSCPQQASCSDLFVLVTNVEICNIILPPLLFSPIPFISKKCLKLHNRGYHFFPFSGSSGYNPTSKASRGISYKTDFKYLLVLCFVSQ